MQLLLLVRNIFCHFGQGARKRVFLISHHLILRPLFLYPGKLTSRVQPGRIGHLHTHSIRQSTADLRTVGGLDQVANNYYTLKQGTLLFATVHKLTGLITVLRLLVQGGWIGQREGFIRLPRGFIGQFFLFENIVLQTKHNKSNTKKIYLFYFNSMAT